MLYSSFFFKQVRCDYFFVFLNVVQPYDDSQILNSIFIFLILFTFTTHVNVLRETIVSPIDFPKNVHVFCSHSVRNGKKKLVID